MSLTQSPLHDRHLAAGAKLAEFGGWEMPLEYPTGVLKEHAAVRSSVGIFDVSHLGKIVVRGEGAADGTAHPPARPLTRSRAASLCACRRQIPPVSTRSSPRPHAPPEPLVPRRS